MENANKHIEKIAESGDLLEAAREALRLELPNAEKIADRWIEIYVGSGNLSKALDCAKDFKLPAQEKKIATMYAKKLEKEGNLKEAVDVAEKYKLPDGPGIAERYIGKLVQTGYENNLREAIEISKKFGFNTEERYRYSTKRLHEEAAELALKDRHYRVAGENFAAAGNTQKAFEVFEIGREFREAAKLASNLGMKDGELFYTAILGYLNPKEKGK